MSKWKLNFYDGKCITTIFHLSSATFAVYTCAPGNCISLSLFAACFTNKTFTVLMSEYLEDDLSCTGRHSKCSVCFPSGFIHIVCTWRSRVSQVLFCLFCAKYTSSKDTDMDLKVKVLRHLLTNKHL